ncbi:hypothetical protein BGW38_000828 [Lunasporangiospora selenospora]|uniref:Uncharacterized protein n=1 Tax=Lunasporangiospora selenospora TaxID=979761 RepID=A0A9P6FV50_9FUNG|nr:hypothetical protein BGW38_000828 [Lunasporangiospora selenospora]
MLTRFPPLRGLSLAPRSLPRPLAATSRLCALSAIHGSSALQRRHQSSSSNRSNDSSGNGGPRNAASSNNSDGDTDSDDDGCDEETDNRSHPEGDPNAASDAPQQPLFDLHRIDLAHGSFFALHRPLLGITNGPMFSNNPYDHVASNNSSNSSSSSNNNGNSIGAGTDYDGLLEDPMEELIHFFDSLYPYGPPVVGQPTLQSVGTTATATAWASMPQLLPGLIVNGVDEFLSDIQDKHAMEQLEYEAEQARLSSRAAAAAASSSTAPPSKTTSDRSGSAWSESESGTESKVYELEDVMQMMNVMRKRMIKMRNSNNNNGNHPHQQGGSNNNNNKSKYRKRSTSPRKKFDK